MRSTTWDTARARALQSEGMSVKEIADIVGASVAAVRGYFNRVEADDLRLQQSLEAARSEVETSPCTAEPQPLTVHDAAELLYALDQIYPGARLECGATEDRFFGVEMALHIREGQDAPDVTVWLK